MTAGDGPGSGPTLRRLAARAPYFHNVPAETLGQAVNFYDRRFDMRLNDDQKQALEEFLRAL